jgi:putative peptide zinc metalloprotease protein
MRDRKRLLMGVPAFARVSETAAEEIAMDFKEEQLPPKAVVMLEGHPGDRFAIIVKGRAEVGILDASNHPVTVAEVGPGDSFGEMALLEPEGHRIATVTALKPLLLLTIDAAAFRRILNRRPDTREAFENLAAQITLTNFLKLCAPFGGLEPAQLRALSGKVERISVPAGTDIVTQGEPGSTCYLVRSGRVEVLLEADGCVRKLSTLGRGSVFGEAALLMEAPRNATVRAIEATEVLGIHRKDLLAALGSDPKVAMRLFELMQVRGRPRQVRGVEVHPRVTKDGSTIYYLKNPALGTYFKLTERGWFLWQQLSGNNGMRELVIAWFAEFKSFDPGAVAQTLRGLAQGGFLEGVKPDKATARAMIKLNWWQRIVLGANQWLDWRWTARDVDPMFQRLYDRGVKFCFSRLIIAVMALVSLAGVVAFFVVAPHGKAVLAAASNRRWLILPAIAISIVLHESAHAFTTKHYRRQVNGIGLGWYRFGPVAFVDTSDMWLGGKWERIAVTSAGPLMNVLLGGVASLLLLGATNRIVVAGLWQFATLNYLLALFNLNPLLELDGYYLIMDWLDRPNLRTKALRWLGHKLPSAIITPGALREHRVDLVYGICTLVYVSILSLLVARSFQAFTNGWLSRWLPGAQDASYVLAGLLLFFFVARIAKELRRE